MISHEDAVKMCAILSKRRQDKARQHEYDITGFQVDRITKHKKSINYKYGGWSSRKSASY